MEQNAGKQRMDGKTLLRNTLTAIIFLIIATLCSAIFYMLSPNSANAAIIYMLAVMLIARYTEGYVPGIVAAAISVICINFVFTYPYMELNFLITGYPIAFLGMMTVAMLTSALTTRTKKQNRILIEQEKLLMDADKEKMRANLLRAVSHDLRTPLTGIIGTSDAYLECADDLDEEEKRNMVRGINEDANWLLNMVENLLSVTRINEDNARVNTVPEPVEEVVSEAVVRIKKRLPGMNINVRVPDEFLMVPMDATLIEQVIINLLENAYFHSGVDSPIDLYVEKADDKVIFHVRDRGRGIDPERIESIFDGEGSDLGQSADSHKGMGIGLTICKTIITAHGGGIYAQNTDPGVEFIFTLPLEEDNNGEQTADPLDRR